MWHCPLCLEAFFEQFGGSKNAGARSRIEPWMEEIRFGGQSSSPPPGSVVLQHRYPELPQSFVWLPHFRGRNGRDPPKT